MQQSPAGIGAVIGGAVGDSSYNAQLAGEPYRVCRRVNILRDYPDDKIKIYP